MTRLRALGLLTVALLATGGAWAQTRRRRSVGWPGPGPSAHQVADLLRYDPVEGTYHLTGHVVFSHRDIKLYCDEAVYDYDENSAVAKGNPRIVSKDTTITGTLVEVDFDNEVAGITGSVTMITQRKREDGDRQTDQNGSPDEEPRHLEEYWEKLTTITCEKIVYEYAEDVKRGTATGRIKAVQEDKTCYADQAVYEELKDTITLTGNVRVLTDKGDEFRCPGGHPVRGLDTRRAGDGRKRRPEENGGESSTTTEETSPPAETPPAEQAPPPAEGGG